MAGMSADKLGSDEQEAVPLDMPTETAAALYGPAPTDADGPYYTTHICTECKSEVEGLHGRWTCRHCGTNSPYIPPPEGWQADPGYAEWK